MTRGHSRVTQASSQTRIDDPPADVLECHRVSGLSLVALSPQKKHLPLALHHPLSFSNSAVSLHVRKCCSASLP